MNRPKLRSTVSVVPLKNNIFEFFLSNIRRSFKVKVKNDKIIDLILSLDGKLTLDEIIAKYEMDTETQEYFINFLNYLQSKSAVKDNQDDELIDYDKYRRVINFLEDFATNKDDIKYMWNNIRTAHVVIVGLGAVGTWISALLVQDGVEKLTLIDNDIVDITNLHRQFGFSESDIGKKKTDCLEKRLKEFNANVTVNKINRFLDESLLEEVLNNDVSLIINCADKPNVDTTSLWVGNYCIQRKIPHIIGGGYNGHISLMGQTVIPYETACIKCFEKGLNDLNTIDIPNTRKLNSPNRKIGSFGPMCTIIASMTEMEAIKILSGKIQPSNINRRGEFNIYTMQITYHEFVKDDNCPWCGTR